LGDINWLKMRSERKWEGRERRRYLSVIGKGKRKGREGKVPWKKKEESTKHLLLKHAYLWKGGGRGKEPLRSSTVGEKGKKKRRVQGIERKGRTFALERKKRRYPLTIHVGKKKKE